MAQQTADRLDAFLLAAGPAVRDLERFYQDAIARAKRARTADGDRDARSFQGSLDGIRAMRATLNDVLKALPIAIAA